MDSNGAPNWRDLLVSFLYKGILMQQLRIRHLTFKCLNQEQLSLTSGMLLEQSLYLMARGKRTLTQDRKMSPSEVELLDLGDR